MDPQAPPPSPIQPTTKPFPFLPTILSVLVLLSLSSTAYLGYQNMQLQKQVAELQKPVPSPTPIPTSIPTPNQTIIPTPTCRPRPACLDATPRCMIPETSDMCPYSCPANGYVNCMPGPNKNMQKCSMDAMLWYKDNCPGFKGAAL